MEQQQAKQKRASQKGLNHRHVSAMNKLKALKHIWSFGWLRAAEVGALLWPASPNYDKQGQKLARDLLAEGLVIGRKLPSQQGRAMVLSEAGATALRDYNELVWREDFFAAAKSGKDWGKTAGALWEPPQSWRHDLITNTLLCRLHQRGFEVMPERTIKGVVEQFDKYPDGLIKKKGKTMWLEVEHARKTGEQMRRMAEHTYLAQRDQIKPIAGADWRPNMGAIAMPAVFDERGYVVNHRQRVINAVSKVADRQFNLVLLHLQMAPGCYVVDAVNHEVVVIRPGQQATP